MPLRQNRASDSTGRGTAEDQQQPRSLPTQDSPPFDRSNTHGPAVLPPAREVRTIELDATPADEQHRRWIAASTGLLAHEAVAPASTG